LAEALRRQSRKKRTAPSMVGNHVLPELPSPGPSPAQDAERADLNNQALAVLRSLPEDYRLPLTLRYVTGADYETIETQLGLSNGALRGLLQRGLKLLRARLGG
jgi:RNA polymerase sigma-70 factor (ECF subfamily)